MMNNMIIGQYVPGDSFIHRMDPRAKLIIVFFYVAVIFLANNIVSYSIIGLFAILAVLVSRVPIYFIIKGLKPILFIIIFTFLLHIFMTREGEVIADIGFLKIYEGGVIQGIYISLRFLFLILLTTLLTLTTTPIEVTDGMETLLHPLKKVRFPVHELALMMSISLRFIPTLMDETDKILKAQTARGVDFSSGPIKDRLKAVVPLLIPLFISAFKRAEELATAMEARGYQGGEGRTKYRQLSWGSIDTMALIIFVIVAAALFIVRV
ncbi:energy-coupling factor transporter transmembrane component T family protein [Priestia endophytica]|jgi:energy-coupling factor transport system permease protein|uniref:Energy-coupling factor transporter transmembrane protein EcfT n=2 Tax=Priestia endophytica TaxID=135735 RepID=A0AAX1QDE2_9BACI|nr:energy-coupling factor transporter transmembrane protein EcfT [Priestia endophytica]KAB2489913.1 energy-coupling factor transporter transmembrane protein EcfT [Priestia endophytica]KYG34055.1 cobalt ABC transporter permease [Priestia endophytica]MCM3540928.1 energy-coupling factor transporter transmembrane protein EcfT [Priestia endophytica]RAS81364.1 cobalt ABC transporter permease [Priestia endophytica]RAS83458.1 cobalt ABC transporter permease [Priestia endophytica]